MKSSPFQNRLIQMPKRFVINLSIGLLVVFGLLFAYKSSSSFTGIQQNDPAKLGFLFQTDKQNTTREISFLTYEKRFCPSVQQCELLKPLWNGPSRQVMVPKYGLTTCIIPKNFSTVFTSILCYIFDAIAYKKEVKDMMKDTFFVRRCQKYNEIFTWTARKNFQSARGGKWRNYMIIREPVERFISGFVDKCILAKTHPEAHFNTRVDPCYGCEENMTCFIQNQYESLQAISNGKKDVHQVENAHFSPQTWHCQMKEHFTDYHFIKYTPSKIAVFLDELLAEFEFFGVPKNVTDDIREQVVGRATFHATSGTNYPKRYRNEIENSQYLKEMLIKMYYYDFLYLDFELPLL
ncbi:unnamed protein product, partial [Mesorhabditis belari]|uniref:Carbohydrate sulfotransferase n=1 Tax=Mesorhabditis belari TaxID=2138241 RepID=A0AAF3FHP2_9BILA